MKWLCRNPQQPKVIERHLRILIKSVARFMKGSASANRSIVIKTITSRLSAATCDESPSMTCLNRISALAKSRLLSAARAASKIWGMLFIKPPGRRVLHHNFPNRPVLLTGSFAAQLALARALQLPRLFRQHHVIEVAVAGAVAFVSGRGRAGVIRAAFIICPGSLRHCPLHREAGGGATQRLVRLLQSR